MAPPGIKPRIHTLDGISHSLKEWSAETGIKYDTLKRRLDYGWSLRRALMTDIRITKWKDVAALIDQGWRIEGHEVVSPTGERRGAWINAIRSCQARRPAPSQSTSSTEPTK